MVRIKVCGLTNKQDALAASRLGVWAAGFIFYKKSPRYIPPSKAATIIRALPKKVIPVGVFVNAPAQEIRDVIRECRLKAVQFHGDEPPVFCAQFKNVITIKALRIARASDLKKACCYATNFILLDTYQKGLFGGTGKSFDWALLRQSKLSPRKLIVSGGLNPENIHPAVASVQAFAFDVSSGVERRPGKKCQRLMRKFFEQAKE